MNNTSRSFNPRAATSLTRPIKAFSIRTRSSKILPNPQQAIIRTIERKIQLQNNQQSKQITQPDIRLPENQAQFKVQNKLWTYFETRMRLVNHKVEKQRINACCKQFAAVQTEVHKYLGKDRSNIQSIERNIKNKNLQINQVFVELKSLIYKKQTVTQFVKNKANKAKELQLAKQRLQQQKNMQEMKQKIAKIKTQIQQLEITLASAYNQLAKLQKEWVNCLRNILKQGYYLNEGIYPFLQQLKDMSQVIIAQDLPYFMDNISKRNLLYQYSIIVKRDLYSDKSKDRVSSRADTKNMIQMGQSNLKSIYTSTSQYLRQWLKGKDWQRCQLPQIGAKAREQERTIKAQWRQEEWRQDQWRRINKKYLGSVEYQRIRGCLFGFRMRKEKQ